MEQTASQASAEKVVDNICRGLVDVYTLDELRKKFANSALTGTPLCVKLGADPSRPDLHLGHAVLLRKMRKLQDLGHKVTMIIGDFTAMIGDPSGRSKTRPPLTLEETRENGRSYKEQVSIILDPAPNKLEIRYNSEWLEPLGASGLIALAQGQTVAQILQREDFSERYRRNIPIGIHELMYPLLQGYDSVFLKADIEFGGTDQTFNCLMGRELQKQRGMEPQVVLVMPILVGLDGTNKMSKSLGNYIGITEPAEVIYRKAMTVPDSSLLQYFQLCTDFDEAEARDRIATNIYEAHKWLASELVRLYHGEESIELAERHYTTIAERSIPENMQTHAISRSRAENGKITLIDLATITGLCSTKGEARRFAANRGLKVNGETITEPTAAFSTSADLILQLGKNNFLRVTFTE